MAEESTLVQGQIAILNRLIRADHTDFSASGARAILKIEFGPSDQARMHELALKAQDGVLTVEEQAEIDAYEVIGHLLGLMHSRARRSLQRQKAGA